MPSFLSRALLFSCACLTLITAVDASSMPIGHRNEAKESSQSSSSSMARDVSVAELGVARPPPPPPSPVNKHREHMHLMSKGSRGERRDGAEEEVAEMMGSRREEKQSNSRHDNTKKQHDDDDAADKETKKDVMCPSGGNLTRCALRTGCLLYCDASQQDSPDAACSNEAAVCNLLPFGWPFCVTIPQQQCHGNDNHQGDGRKDHGRVGGYAPHVEMAASVEWSSLEFFHDAYH